MNRFRIKKTTTLSVKFCVAFFLLMGGISVSKAQTTFTATAPNVPIAINDNAPASPYPSTVNVSGMGGLINKITVTITGLSHTDSDEIDIMLVNPAQTHAVVLMSDVGDDTDLSNVNLTFDDAAPVYIPTGAFGSGVYKPTNIGANDQFAGATPTTANIASLGELIGTNANGAWRLYVVDDQHGDTGSITGWSLTVTTGAAYNGGALTINDNAAATPYASNINVSGLIGATTRITVRLNNVRHTFSDDIGVLLVSPTGVKIRLMADVGGASNLAGDALTFEDGAPSMPDSAALTATSFSPTLGTSSGDGNAHPANFPAPAPAAPYVGSLASVNGTNPNGVWSLFVDDDSMGHNGSIGSWTLGIVTDVPAAALSFVTGHVLTRGRSGISRANVTIVNLDTLESMTTVTNQFGYFSFTNLRVGDVYSISVEHRKHSFPNPVQVISLLDAAEVDFFSDQFE